MKEKMISKIILVLIISLVLLAMPKNIFATSGGPADLDNYLEGFEGQSGDLKTDPTQGQEQTTGTTPTPAPQPGKEESLPKAGLVEDTMIVVAVMTLGAVAIFANKKVNELQNI